MSISEKNSKSIGLIFEPNFFTAHFYEDEGGKNFLVSRKHSEKTSQTFEIKAEVNPLYALFSSMKWTLVPRAVFRAEDAERYLTINTGFEGSGEANYVEIPRIESTLVYEKDERAGKITEDLHPSLAIRPVIVALINYASVLAEGDFPDSLHLHVRDKIAYIIIMQNRKLLLANSIEIKKSIDLDYFTFYVMKKLGIPPEVPFFFTSYQSEYSKLSNSVSDRLENPKDIPVFQENKKPINDIDLLALIAPECA